MAVRLASGHYFMNECKHKGKPHVVMPGLAATRRAFNSQGKPTFDPYCFCKYWKHCCDVPYREHEAGQAVTHWQEGFISKEKMVTIHQMYGISIPTCAKCHVQIQHCGCNYEIEDRGEKCCSACKQWYNNKHNCEFEPQKPEPILDILNDESDDVVEPGFNRTFTGDTYFYPGLFETQLAEEANEQIKIEEEKRKKERSEGLRILEEARTAKLEAERKKYKEEADKRQRELAESAKKRTEKMVSDGQIISVSFLPKLPSSLYPIGAVVVVSSEKRTYRNISNRWVEQFAKKSLLLGHDPDDPNVNPYSGSRAESYKHLARAYERRNQLAKHSLDNLPESSYTPQALMQRVEQELHELQMKAQEEINEHGVVSPVTQRALLETAQRFDALRYPASAVQLEKTDTIAGWSTVATIPNQAIQDEAVTEKQLETFFPNAELKSWPWKVLKDTIVSTLNVRYDDISITKSTKGEILNRGDVIRIVVKEQFGNEWKFYTLDIDEKVYHKITKWDTNENVRLIREGFHQFLVDRQTYQRREQIAVEQKTARRRKELLRRRDTEIRRRPR
jgi:hypothetical protein